MRRAHWLGLRWLLALAAGPASTLATAAHAAPAAATLVIEPSAWRLVESESGPVNYYRLVRESDRSFLRSSYQPPMKTAVMGWQAPDAARARAAKLAWSWRPQTLPRGGDECSSGKEDSAAVVYLTWKRGLRFYTLKYVWSAAGVKGSVCGRKRNPFVAQDTVVLESGQGGWRRVEIDLRAKFREHFADGDAKADVPDFVGIGLMSDGDQTRSPSSADFGRFELALAAAG